MSVTIPAGVTSIGYYAFSSCDSLTSVTFAEGSKLTYIGGHAFSNCTKLTSITIPTSVTSIGDRAFQECTNLTSITIPNSVTSIGRSAFYNCTKLTDIYFGGTEEQWNAITKGSGWNSGTPNYTVHCSDGDIAKS